MAYNRNQARSICSKAEFDLFVSSLRGEIEKLPQTRLQSGIQRSRTLRDKYRDLHKRQRLRTRDRTGTKKGVKPDTNARTEQKAKLFAETLERFEARLNVVQREAADSNKATRKKASRKKASKKKATKKKATKKKATKKTVSKKAVSKKAVSKKAPGKAGKFISAKAAGSDKRQRQQTTRSKAVMGHTRSSTQRRQAKRDGGKKR